MGPDYCFQILKRPTSTSFNHRRLLGKERDLFGVEPEEKSKTKGRSYKKTESELNKKEEKLSCWCLWAV